VLAKWTTRVTGPLAAVLLATSCTESVGPRPKSSSPGVPLFSYSASGITLDKDILSLSQRGRLLIKGFNPQNPHVGDAIIATFYWLGTTNIDSVVDVLTSSPYTPVGNTYHLVQYVTAGGISMATYVATNVRNFPDAGTDPSQILAVGAYLSDSVADGGIRLSAWTGVEDVFAQALGSGAGAPRSASGAGTTPTVASPGSIAVSPGALVYGVSAVTPPVGVDYDPAFTEIRGSGSDGSLKEDGVYAVLPSSGSANPQWTWYFNQVPGGGTWLATALTLNAGSSGVPATGDLTATAATSGSSIDPDGYVVTLDGTSNQSVPTNGSATFAGIPAGSHSVALSGVAANCTVSSPNPQTVNVPAGGTATVAYSVNCDTPTGNLTVSTTSSGSSIPTSYTATVDANPSQTVASTGTVTFSNLSAGSHTVVLSVPANCTVSGGASQTVTVPAGGTVTASYTVNCITGTGNLTVSTTSGGSSIPSSYTATVDANPSQTVASTGTVTFSNLSAGSHTVVLNVPTNCTVSGGASQTVTVPAGGTVTASYTVNCITPPGNMTVTTSSSGANIPSSYTATVDGSQSKTIASTGSVTFTALAAGSHTVVLNVPTNCTVSGGASRSVTVPSGGTVTVSYSVNCNAPPVVNAGPDETALTGALYALHWSFTDANHNGPWSYTINWGDGSTSSGTVSSEGSFSNGHTYVIILPRSFTIRVTVTDTAGAAGSDTKVVSVLLL